MKKIKLIIMFASVFMMSCEDFVSKDDLNPSLATAVPDNGLLPAIEVCLFATYTGSTSRNTSMFIQHSEGAQFQSEEFGVYNIQENDNTNEWQTIYNSGVATSNILINQASASPRYVGIAKVLKVWLLGIATDFWGDIPYKEAGLLEKNVSPKFDSQADVLNFIQADLDEAIADLSKTDAENKAVPRGDDLLFGGDGAKWIKIAYLLKARYANRLSKIDPNGSADKVIAAINSSGMTSSADDANAFFTSEGGTALNQWYDFNTTRAGYIVMSATLVDRLKSTNDPRLPIYCFGTTFSGSVLGDKDASASKMGEFFATADASLPLATYTEAMFLLAEAQLRKGDNTAAQDAYSKALNASLDTYSGSPRWNTTVAGAYLAANETLPATGKLETVMTQKWIALITQPELWTDWRRTGFPTLAPNPEGFINEIPRRLPTEQNERLYNANAVVVSDLTTRMYFDKE